MDSVGSDILKLSNIAREEEVDLDDDILNNPEKLMKIKFDEPLLQVAYSPTFDERLQYFTDTLLQGIDVQEFLVKKQKSNEEVIVDKLCHMEEVIRNEQQECRKIIEQCSSKEFWRPETRKELLSESQKLKVQEWMEAIEEFAKHYENARRLRDGRKSCLPNRANDNDEIKLVQLVEKLKQINGKLSQLSKIFDSL